MRTEQIESRFEMWTSFVGEARKQTISKNNLKNWILANATLVCDGQKRMHPFCKVAFKELDFELLSEPPSISLSADFKRRCLNNVRHISRLVYWNINTNICHSKVKNLWGQNKYKADLNTFCWRSYIEITQSPKITWRIELWHKLMHFFCKEAFK